MPKITTRNLQVAYNFDEDYCTCSVKEKTLVYTSFEVCNLHCVSIVL